MWNSTYSISFTPFYGGQTILEQQDWTLTGADGQPIYGTTHLPEVHAIGVLILSHGFKGYKDYGLFPQLAEAAATRGLIAHRFNFSHSGMTPNTATFETAELFEKDTWSKQIHDLQVVAHAAANSATPTEGCLAGATADTAQSLPQVWFGHSRGGLTTALTAGRAFDRKAEETEPTKGGKRGIGAHADDMPRPAGVAIASSPDRAVSMSQQQREMLRKAGRMAVPSSRTGQTLYVGLPWLEEVEADPQAYDPLLAIARIGCPLLLIHGDEDTTVPPVASEHYAEAARSRTQLRRIPNASHTYNCPNPLPLGEQPPQATHELFKLVCDFAVRQCT